MTTKPSNRLLALDILRGITIAGMLLVNNPGSWGSIYAPLQHASWNGLTPTDLVFPFFMFIMGISTYFSLRKFEFKLSGHLAWKIIRRSIVIFAIGIAIHLFGHTCYALARGESLGEAISSMDTFRALGVMQRLAICYFFAAFVAVTVKFKWIPVLIAVLLVGYSIAIIAGNGYATDSSNIIAQIDAAILGQDHMYGGTGAFADAGIKFDPEGLFSTIPSIAHVLIGLCCGYIFTKTKDNWKRISDLFIVGAILTFTGFLLSYGLPLNKNIWSPTFAITTCGLAATLLGLLIWIIDIKGNKKWCRFFETFGINPLFLYVLGGVLSILFSTIYLPVGGESVNIHNIIYKVFLLNIFPDNALLASCLYAIIFIIICWCIGYPLYRKKIYIKI